MEDEFTKQPGKLGKLSKGTGKLSEEPCIDPWLFRNRKRYAQNSRLGKQQWRLGEFCEQRHISNFVCLE
jgi:hypothetical protein